MTGPDVGNPAFIDVTLDSRAATFENPTGARGAGGRAYGGRKGAPNRRLAAGGSVVLADIEGSGVVRHLWMTVPPAPPERMRALRLEVFYDGAGEPSVSVPVLDFFGLPHGRPVPYASALATAQEGRGFNSYLPMPFRAGCRIVVTNADDRPMVVFYQVDYTLQPGLPDALGYLHATFRRENPTVRRRDFVIVAGLRGPGRFLGANVGIRVLDGGDWYGEGEVKVYRDGDTDHPTICGTGLEDYVGSAWGMGAHSASYGGAPLVVGEPGRLPDFVGLYRWHLLDPIMFATDLTVTVQQIGNASFRAGDEAALAGAIPAGEGWIAGAAPGRMLAWGLVERVDDYCATAFVYCAEPQPVPRPDVALVTADIGRRPYESPGETEVASAAWAADLGL